MDFRSTRRRWLASCTAGSIASLAGCTGGSDDSGNGNGNGGSGNGDDDDSFLGIGNGGDDELITESTWPMYNVDAQNTGHHPEATGPKGEVTERWTFEPEDDSGSLSFFESGVIADERYFIAGPENRLYCLNLETGERNWRFENGFYRAIPAVADGNVICPGEQDATFALNTTSGDIEWEDSKGAGEHQVGTTIVNDIAYVPTTEGNLYGVNIGSGEIEFDWGFEDAAISSTPAIDGGILYFASLSNDVRAYDLEAGERIWTYGTDGREAGTGEPAVANGTVYTGSENFAIAIDADSGDERWEKDIEEGIVGGMTVWEDFLFCGTLDNRLIALDAETGDKLWQFETGARVTSDPCVVDGSVYFGSLDNSVYSIDIESQEKNWEYDTGDQIYMTPTVVDGVVYVATTGNTVFALEEAD